MAISSVRRPAGVDPGRRVQPEWTTLGCAVLAPVVLVGGDLLARSAQPLGAYDPVRQSVSTLAGLGATDRWLMTTALVLLGLAQLAVARGLHGVPGAARAVLAVGGVCVFVVALAPQPARGSSPVHMAGMVVGCLAFALWPLVAALVPGWSRPLRAQSLVAAAAMLALLGWLCAQAWTDGTWLGVAERGCLVAQMVWPVRLAAAGMRTAGAEALERAALPLALLAPVVLVGGFVAAAAAQPRYDPVAQSISTLAGRGATDRWIMAGALVALGVLYVLVAAGLRRVPTPARGLLGLGGVLVVIAGLEAQPADGSNPVHMTAAALAWLAFVAWPLAITAADAVDDRWRRASAVASGALALLVVWFAVELWGSGALYGASQRVVLVAQTVWPVVVAVAARHRNPARTTSRGPGS